MLLFGTAKVFLGKALGVGGNLFHRGSRKSNAAGIGQKGIGGAEIIYSQAVAFGRGGKQSFQLLPVFF